MTPQEIIDRRKQNLNNKEELLVLRKEIKEYIKDKFNPIRDELKKVSVQIAQLSKKERDRLK
jgi:S-adenosylmethionine:tRNA-ribosyltransferase-isomerase (queuine synthetase)